MNFSNRSQAAQFVQTGNADVGIIALSLAITPEFTATGRYSLIPADQHSPLEQGFVVLKGARDKPLAKAFAEFFKTPGVRTLARIENDHVPSCPREARRHQSRM